MTAQLNARVLSSWVVLHAWAMGQEMTRTGALEHSIRVFNWMKAQRCYRARNDIYNNMIWLHARHQSAEQARGLFFEMQEWRSAAILFFFLFVERQIVVFFLQSKSDGELTHAPMVFRFL
jgi:hypothetical protein